MIERRRILIVEDEPLIAMMLEDFLDALDYKAVAVVDTIAAALAKVAEGEIDATILDVNLRGGIWFGWSGNEAEHFTGQLTMERVDGFTTATVDLEPQDVDEYYNGYANRTLDRKSTRLNSSH